MSAANVEDLPIIKVNCPFGDTFLDSKNLVSVSIFLLWVTRNHNPFKLVISGSKVHKANKAEGMDLTLIGAISPFVHRVIWALELKGLEFNYVKVDMFSNSQLLLDYNPVHKKVPILLHGIKILIESGVILEYIEETWPGTHCLLPIDPYERALARFWIKFGDDNIRTCLTFFVTVGEDQAKAVTEAREVLGILEKEALKGKRFFGGDEIGMVDLVFGWIACFLDAMEKASGAQVMGKGVDDFPKLKKWCTHFRNVSVVQKTELDPEEMLSYLRRRREMFIRNIENGS